MLDTNTWPVGSSVSAASQQLSPWITSFVAHASNPDQKRSFCAETPLFLASMLVTKSNTLPLRPETLRESSEGALLSLLVWTGVSDELSQRQCLGRAVASKPYFHLYFPLVFGKCAGFFFSSGSANPYMERGVAFHSEANTGPLCDV